MSISRVSRNQSALPIEGFENNQRRSGRLRVDLLQCDLGKVLDLSATGMRVQSRYRFPDTASGTVRLDSPLGRLVLPTRLVWQKRVGMRRYECGLTFAELSEAQRAALAAVVKATVTHAGLGRAA